MDLGIAGKVAQFREVFSRIAAGRGQIYEEHVAARAAEWPVRRIVTLDDIAAAAVLCSDLAGLIAGQVLVVDGCSGEALQ